MEVNNMKKYTVSMDKKKHLFTVVEKNNKKISACGKSIEEAVNKLIKKSA
ncbi:DUF5945 family protein [Companilactobacillus jidongensis]|nr:DUF5945 family protein [Companilactobacillus jidongensis]